MEKKVYPDQPANAGVKNALLRAQQLLKLRWTPVGTYNGREGLYRIALTQRDVQFAISYATYKIFGSNP